MGINDDIYRCTAHELEICVRKCWKRAEGRHSHIPTYTRLCVYLSLCVCDSQICLPQIFPLTFDPRVGVKPWQMRWPVSGQNCKHSTTIFCPPPPLSSYPSFLTPSLLSVQSMTESQRKFSLNTNMFYCTCFGNFKVHISQIKNSNTGWIYYTRHLPCLQKKRKQKNMILKWKLCLRFGYYNPALWKHTVCLESLSVMSRMRNVAVWFFTHAAGSSISGNISHSASLTPSALLQYPHIFPSFHFFPLPPLHSPPLWPLLLLLPFLSTAPP